MNAISTKGLVLVTAVFLCLITLVATYYMLNYSIDFVDQGYFETDPDRELNSLIVGAVVVVGVIFGGVLNRHVIFPVETDLVEMNKARNNVREKELRDREGQVCRAREIILELLDELKK